MRANQMQAKLFSEEVRAVLQRYELKQLTSAEVVERLVEIAKQLRDARHRHEQLGLSEEEAAFYDALAGGVEDVKADPELSEDRARTRRGHPHRPDRGLGRPRGDRGEDPREDQAPAAQAQVPAAQARPGGGGGGDLHGFDYAAQLVLDQAKALYRYWPDVEVGDRLFV